MHYFDYPESSKGRSVVYSKCLISKSILMTVQLYHISLLPNQIKLKSPAVVVTWSIPSLQVSLVQLLASRSLPYTKNHTLVNITINPYGHIAYMHHKKIKHTLPITCISCFSFVIDIFPHRVFQSTPNWWTCHSIVPIHLPFSYDNCSQRDFLCGYFGI